MAPEVINSEPYDEKSDVYSFGILLWEILTGDVPFRGLKDVQVAMAVVENQSRPMIPQDCPPRLGKFIKFCWDQDPKRRPSFDNIVKAMESGEVVFPGTNMNAVKAYITRFAKPVEVVAPQSMVMTQTPSVNALEDLVKRLSTDGAAAAIQQLRKNLSDQGWLQQALANNDFLPGLLKASENCSSADMAADLLSIFAVLAACGNVLTPQHVSRAFQVFFNFGTTQMKEILVFIQRTLPILKETKLNAQQLVKIAAFLQTTDVQTRIDSTLIFTAMLQYEVFDKPESLKNLLPYVISNCNSDAMPELLGPSLQIVQILLGFQVIRDAFLGYNGLQAITSIFTVPKPDAVSELAIAVFAQVVTTILISEEAIKVIVGELGSIFLALKGDILARFLAALTGLLGFKTFYKCVSADQRAPLAFQASFKNGSPAAKLIALKIVYALLVKSISHKAMASVAPAVISLLNSEVDAIGSLAAVVLVSAVPEWANPEELLTEELSKFLTRGLSQESILSAPALRLAGALTNSLTGAQWLESVGVIPRACAFLTSQNGIFQRLALMFCASFSSAYPMSPAALQVLPIFLQAVAHEQLHPYPLIFLSNVVMAPDGARYATSALPTFGVLLKSRDESVVRGALTVILRVVSCPEAIGLLRDPNAIAEVYRAAVALLDGKLFLPMLEVLSSLSGTPAGKKALGETPLPQVLAETLARLPKKDVNRPTLMRILARCKQG
jgi:hypothetical protein